MVQPAEHGVLEGGRPAGSTCWPPSAPSAPGLGRDGRVAVGALDGAGSDLTLRHSRQVLPSDPLQDPSIARLRGRQGLLPDGGGLRPRPPHVAGSGSGLEPPAPPSGRDPRWPKTRPNPARKGPNFSGFLAPCGAAPRGGGGAPPTTLILLRNQFGYYERRVARHDRRRRRSRLGKTLRQCRQRHRLCRPLRHCPALEAKPLAPTPTLPGPR